MELSPQTAPAKPKLLLFDVYETLLDMEMIERRANALLNSKRGYTSWFELFMQYCFVDNCIQVFNPFPKIAKATLQMAGRTYGENVTDNQADELVDLLNHLPLKENVTENLSLFYDLGYRIAALTNATKEIIENRMERTGLISYFEEVMSAEEVKKYKPAVEVYQWAAGKLNLQPEEILFVSSHSWDIAGAARAGMQTVFLQQDRQLLYALAPKPTLTATSLEKLGGELQEIYH